jgi:hypothetical protein
MLAANKVLRMTLLVAAAAAGLGQGENEPYFALSSGRTFGSGEKPRVSVSAWKVDSLEFRVYRIDDPVQFFEQIESPHEFGGRAPSPPHERTLLERFHLWKRGVRADIRRSLRAQFTESPGARFERIFPRQATPVSKGVHYAEAPLLNPRQLVLSFVQPVRSRGRWNAADVEIGVREKGVYLVEAVRGELRAYTVLMVSDIVLITKTGGGRVVNMVVDRNTGEPVSGADVLMLGRDARKGEAATDADGVAEMRVADAHPNDVRIVARRGADFAVNTLSEYAFTLVSDRWVGYIYTDRPVYRPGHTVHFKGILRVREAAGYEVPAGRAVQVRIQDAEQKPIYQKTLTTTATGAIHDELALPAAAPLGYYYISVNAGKFVAGGNFEVEEYRKPEYEVRVTPSKARVLEGETVPATIDARYYFGEPVNGASVKWAVYRDRYWPFWFDADEEDEFQPGGDGGDDSGDAGDQLNQGEGRLDADGKLAIQLQTSVSGKRLDYRYRIEARVTDQAKREITGKGYVTATYGSFLVNAQPERYFYAPGSKAAIAVQARDYDNNPIRTHVKVELRTWAPRHPDGEVKAAAEIDTGADGNGTAQLDIPAQGGSYRVRASAHTPEGREVEDFAYLWVSGSPGWGPEPGANRITQIVPDKKTYRAGDTARLLIVAGRPNAAVYVTVEGRDLRQWKLLRARDSTAQFELPITADDEPGITVTAASVQDGALLAGQKYLRIPPVEHKLNVQISTDKPQYLPAQSADYSIEATDGAGRPAPGAEFSLGVVDEAIYAIRRDSTGDILNFFFGREWNRVNTEYSLNYFFHGEAGKRRMRLAEVRPASHLAQLKPERLAEPKIRKAFPDTAFWAADVVTGADGRARAKVEFPDSLTTWRATARGATPDTKVGSATLKTIVRKNLILRLAAPRFFVQGDEVAISAIVHNYLTETKTARVSLELAGLDVLEGKTTDVQIPSRAEAHVEWRVRARQVREAKIVGKALTDEESDALEVTLPVNVPGVKLAVTRGGTIPGGGAAAFDLAFPAAVEPGSRALSIRVSPSIVGSLFGALEYLTSFPYGCVEQTMSSFLPNITVAQAVRDLGLKTELDQGALQDKIHAGLDRLYGFQHEDGGWGWWETDESQHFMTAYVVAGLAQAKAAGVKVNDEAIRKGAVWVRKSFAADPRLAGDLRAYMAYALAVTGNANGGEIDAVYGRRSDLSPYGLALLGLALEEAKDARAAETASALERAAQQDQEQAWWPATRDQLLDFPVDATPEATAWAVKLLSHQRRESPLLPKAALWLMNHRNEGYWWSSTKQTAMVIYGLADYLKISGELNPNLDVTVFVNGKPALATRIAQATALDVPSITLDESKLEPGSNRIRIAASGQGRLYYSARAEYSSTEDKLQKAGTTSLNILRDYFRLVPGRDGERIVYDTAPLIGAVSSGDIIAVRLTVTGSDWKYLMVEDPIPAGAEFIERDESYQLRNRPPWWEYFFTRRELHDDRLAIFQTSFPQGQRQYFYLLKVENPGIFKVSPARVQPMYQTDVLATSESRRLEVK